MQKHNFRTLVRMRETIFVPDAVFLGINYLLKINSVVELISFFQTDAKNWELNVSVL